MTIISKNLTELAVGDVIVDIQGAKHTVTEPIEPYHKPADEFEPEHTGWTVYTDTYPRGGIMNGRSIVPDDGTAESVTFRVLA